MDTAQAAVAAGELLNAAVNALGQYQAAQAIIAKAQAEGRTSLTDAEWAGIDADNATALSALDQANLKP
jgi:hypothetical protein